MFSSQCPRACHVIISFSFSSSTKLLKVPIILTENDIPGASLNGRNPSSLKNEELKFWLRCRGDSLKGLKTKACFVKRWAYATIYTRGFGGTFTLIIFVFIIGSKNISRLVEIRWWSIRIKIRFIRKERPGFQICRPNAPLKLQPQSIQAMAGENHLKGCRRFRGPKWTSTLKVLGRKWVMLTIIRFPRTWEKRRHF